MGDPYRHFTIEHLRAMARDVEDVRTIAGGPSDGTIPEPYRAWGFARFYTPNVQFCAAGGRQPEATDDGG